MIKICIILTSRALYLPRTVTNCHTFSDPFPHFSVTYFMDGSLRDKCISFVENCYKSVIAMEAARIDLHTKTLKLVDIEISRRTLLCFAWLVLCLIVNYNTRFSGLGWLGLKVTLRC